MERPKSFYGIGRISIAVRVEICHNSEETRKAVCHLAVDAAAVCLDGLPDKVWCAGNDTGYLVMK
jgi:hypothetical protein